MNVAITNIVTRFNIKMNFAEESKNANISPNILTDEVYLKKRMELFKKYTYPSIVNQSYQNLNWYCFFSNETPLSIKSEIEDLKKYKNFYPIYISDEESMRFSFVLRENLIQKMDVMKEGDVAFTLR